MKYKLEQISWDITSRCNLNCIHCGEGGGRNRPDLTTEEALDLADQIVEMGVESVCFTGGEPFARPDWDSLALRLQEGGVQVDIISNGTLIDADVVQKLQKCHVRGVAISVDGTRAVHEGIRGSGVYSRVERGFALLKETDVYRSTVTAVMKQNLSELWEMRDELIRMDVEAWQLQIAMPYGNMEDHMGSLLEPADMDTLIDFCYEAAQKGGIRIVPADCIGYYTKKDSLVRGLAADTGLVVWQGCRAGISSITIRSDGNVAGKSMCLVQHSYSVKEGTLRDIWETESHFALEREFDCKKMQGFCGRCPYLPQCGGGCALMRLGFGGSVYADNRYCAYQNYLRRTGQI